MRVLIVADHFPPAAGGLAVQCERLSAGLGARGHHVVTVAVDEANSRELRPHHELIRRTVSLNRMPRVYQPGSPVFHPPWPDPEFRRGLQAVVDDFRPDVVHVHGWSIFSVAALNAPRAPIVATLHDYGIVCPKKSLARFTRRCTTGVGLPCVTCDSAAQSTPRRSALAAAMALNRRWMAPRVRRWLAVSEYVARAHCDVPVVATRIQVTPPLIELPRLTHRPPDEPPYVLYVGPGEENPDKGRSVLLEAFRRARLPGFRVVLVGGRHPMSAPGVDDRGYLFGAELETAFRGASFAIVPSVWPDPCPAVAVEALARNRPVIASAVGGLGEIVENERTGLLVQPGDPTALAAAITRLAQDPDTRAAMGERARDSVERFASSRVLSAHEELYDELALDPGGRRGQSGQSSPALPT